MDDLASHSSGHVDATRDVELLVAKLQSAAARSDQEEDSTRPDGDEAATELLHAAATALTNLMKELSQQQEKNANDQSEAVVKPSAWLTREMKYKQDLAEVRRKLAAREEEHVRMSEQLEAASSGTLVQKLRADLKALEAANAEHKVARAELSTKLTDLAARNQVLVNSSTSAAALWRDICAGKRAAHVPGLDHSGSLLRTSMSGLDSPASPSTMGDGGGNVVIEHLSVSDAKAKLAQQQLSSFNSHNSSSYNHGLERRTSTSTPGGPISPALHHLGFGIGSRASSRRCSISSNPATAAAAAAAVAASNLSGGGAALHTNGDLTIDLLGSLDKPLAGAAVVAGDSAAPQVDDDEDNESRLLDIDDLLALGAGAGQPGTSQADSPASPAVAVQPIVDDGSNPASVFATAGTESLTAAAAPPATTDMATDAAEMDVADAACQGHVLPAAEEASTQMEAVEAMTAATATQCEPSEQQERSSQTQVDVNSLGLQVELTNEGQDASTQASPATGMDASVQAIWPSADRSSQAGDSSTARGVSTEVQATANAADAATQAETVAAGSHAATQADVMSGLDVATQAEVAAATDAATQADAALGDVDAVVTKSEPATAEAKGHVQRLQASEAVAAAAQLEAARATEAAATAQSALQQTAGELLTAKDQHAQAMERVDSLEAQVAELQALLQAHKSMPPEGRQQSAEEAVDAGRLEDLERQLALQIAEVQEARAAAVKSAKALVQAQDELAQARDALHEAEAQLEALKEREERMQLEIQAYEHTMAGLKLAVEEADVDKQVQEAQAFEMAEKMAYLTEFVSVKAKNPKHATLDYASWLKKRPKEVPPPQTPPS